MIVIEGPDHGGKTTLVKDLSERYSLPVAERVVGKDTESLVPSLKAWTEDNVARGWQATIFDRHRLISEPIYGPILRNRPEPGFSDAWWLASMYRMFYGYCRPLIIYCMPDLDVVLEGAAKDIENQPIAVRRNLTKIYSAYAAKAGSDGVLAGALIYDYQRSNQKYLYRHIEISVEKMYHTSGGFHV